MQRDIFTETLQREFYRMQGHFGPPVLHEFNNQFNKFESIQLLNSEEMVGHLPHEYLRIACYFLACVEVSSHL